MFDFIKKLFGIHTADAIVPPVTETTTPTSQPTVTSPDTSVAQVVTQSDVVVPVVPQVVPVVPQIVDPQVDVVSHIDDTKPEEETTPLPTITLTNS
jgi:hypothetical protein